MRNIKVKDVMTAHPAMILPNTTLKDAAIRMRDVDCGVLPIGHEDKIKGIITDRDIVVRAISHDKDAREEMVKDYMSTNIHACHESDTLENAVETMRQHRVSRLVVKNKADRVTGILSFGDVLWRGGDVDEIAAIIKHAITTKVA